MTGFDISLYLKRTCKNKGLCKCCDKEVPWSREKLIGHKSASCVGLSANEKQFFKNQRAERKNNTFISNDESSVTGSSSDIPNKRQRNVDTFADRLTIGERDDITKAFASLFYRTGIPFNVIESNALKVHKI